MSDPTLTPSSPGEAPAATAVGPRSATRDARSWLWIALPVMGLTVVPLVGIVYAETATFGLADPSASAQALAFGDDGDGASLSAPVAKGAAKKKPARLAKKTSDKPRLASAAVCCAKLHQLGKTAELEERATFLAAASLCDASTEDEENAFVQVGRAIRTARQQVPEECKP